MLGWFAVNGACVIVHDVSDDEKPEPVIETEVPAIVPTAGEPETGLMMSAPVVTEKTAVAKSPCIAVIVIV